jgi:hypothetical protein
MKKIAGIIYLCVLLFVASGVSAKNFQMADTTIEGRWDITINEDGKEIPSWLEVRHSGRNHLIGEYVGSSGSARPVSKINFSNGKMSFTIPPQWEQEDNDLVFEATLSGDNLSGTLKAANGKSYNWSAMRAPSLQRHTPTVWGKPIRLFNGTNLKGWHTMGENQWKVEGGLLRNPRAGSNLVTDNLFTDFKLHVEFRYPNGSNSGIYLRGRYEVQIEDNKGSKPSKNEFGGVYGFISPTEMVAKKAGQWQTYDITLVGRMITVVANGKMIICNQEIPGITGGALNSKEGEPGPIFFQGDHGAIDYRNIIITPAK